MARTVGPSSYFDPTDIDSLEAPTADLLKRRVRAQGPAYRLFSREPLHAVRGEGVSCR